MDPKERARKQSQLEQGKAFERLSAHGDWTFFRIWMERARNDYESLLHHPDERNGGVAMARWAEGYDAINNLLSAYDRALRRVPELTAELEQEDSGATAEQFDPITGRKLT